MVRIEITTQHSDILTLIDENKETGTWNGFSMPVVNIQSAIEEYASALSSNNTRIPFDIFGEHSGVKK